MTGQPERADPDWDRYPSTVLVFGDKHVVDLRAPVTEAARSMFAAHGLAGAFAVITAHDPRGEDLPRRRNAERAAALQEQLRARNVAYVAIDACSPDRTHCERSVATAIDHDSAVDIARSFEQVAIFWYDGSRFWIVGVLVDTDPIPLPRTV